MSRREPTSTFSLRTSLPTFRSTKRTRNRTPRGFRTRRNCSSRSREAQLPPFVARSSSMCTTRCTSLSRRNEVSPAKPPREDLEYYIQNAVRFPTSGNAFLRTYPALVVPDADDKINVLLIAENRNQSASGFIDLSFDKPLHGSKNLVVPAHGAASETIEFRTAEAQTPGAPPPVDHLFHAAIEVRAGPRPPRPAHYRPAPHGGNSGSLPLRFRPRRRR